MADCKTMMVRRNSRDAIGACGSLSSGGASHPCHHAPPPPQHHHYQHHHHHRNNSRSKSYHHHHSNQHFYHNQCQYYNNSGPPPYLSFQNGYGYFPPTASPPPPPTPSTGPEQHHQQHNLLASVENNFIGHGPPRPTRYQQQVQQQEPPPRPWIHLAHHKHKRTCFTVLCYNILCSRYATHAMYSYCPSWALDWNYRRKAILQELVHYTPDIISLQEMETDQYYNFFLPQLQVLGYSGIFAAKSRARTMVESKRKLVDGCAIFYKTNKFRLLSEHLIEFSQVAISKAAQSTQCSEEMLNRVQTKDNIAIAALLEAKPDSEQGKGLRGLVTPKPRPLLVCTCHLHWDPNYCDVKLVQTMMLMQELMKITESIDLEEAPVPHVPSSDTRENGKSRSHHNARSGSSSSSGSTASCSLSNNNNQHQSPLDKVNLLVCGDFNSLPQSGVVEFMHSGIISRSHPDFKGHNYESYIERDKLKGDEDDDGGSGHCLSTTGKSGGTNSHLKCATDTFQHDFNVKSVYSPCTMPFTNYTLDFQGVIDYIFYSVKGLRPLGLLGPLDPAFLVQQNIGGAPHPFIPSDHFPLLSELEMIPAI